MSLAGEHLASGARMAMQRQQISAAFGPAVVQRLLVMDNPDGTKPAITLNRIDAFRDMPIGKRLWEHASRVFVNFKGVHKVQLNSVCIEHEEKMYVYRVTDGAMFDYDAGQPRSIVMTGTRVVNGESLQEGGADRHSGLMFSFVAQWDEGRAAHNNGMLITEVITPRSSTGWFAQAGDRQQNTMLAMSPGQSFLDLIGISSSKQDGLTSGEQHLPTDVEGSSATEASEGTWTGFQHFEYIDNTGARQLVPNSGFLLVKRMDHGVLQITRTPAAGDGVGPGVVEGLTQADIEIRFSGQ